MYQTGKVDLRAFGQAVQEAREKKGWTREKLAEAIDRTPRFVMYIETRGQHTSVQILYEIVTLLNVSIDQFFFPDTSNIKDTRRRQLDAMIDGMSDKELHIMTGTATAIQEIREAWE